MAVLGLQINDVIHTQVRGGGAASHFLHWTKANKNIDFSHFQGVVWLEAKQYFHEMCSLALFWHILSLQITWVFRAWPTSAQILTRGAIDADTPAAPSDKQPPPPTSPPAPLSACFAASDTHLRAQIGSCCKLSEARCSFPAVRLRPNNQTVLLNRVRLLGADVHDTVLDKVQPGFQLTASRTRYFPFFLHWIIVFWKAYSLTH